MFEWLAELTRETLYLNSGIHISDNNELIIDNCRRIEECDDIFMQFISGKLRVQVWGSGLRAFDFRTRGLVIRGRITRVEFAERRRLRNERPASGKH